jgi:Fe-S-cluster containining protein
MSAPQSEPTVGVNVDLSVGDYRMQGRLSIPAGPTSLRVMLPVIQSLADGMVNLAVKTIEDRGKSISCTKGCGACCRQLVPITEVEGRNIRAVIEDMPEPRRAAVYERFADARRRLADKGMLGRLLDRKHWDIEEFQRIGMEYFHLGIPCPFLEDESCSIHTDRPITCREYLVTSPAVNCAAPRADNIDWVPLAVKVWRELARFDAPQADSPFLRWVPLILAPEWAEANPDEPPLRPGPEWLGELFERIAAKATNQGETTSPAVPTMQV